MRQYTHVGRVVLGMAVVLVTLLEVSLRACPPQLLPTAMQHWLTAQRSIGHPALGALERPQATGLFVGPDFRVPYRTDTQGFYNLQPWPDAADIVVVGDDMTVGYGVDTAHAWPALIAQTIAPNQVLNLALRDAGPMQYARAYALFGVPRQPRVLLVGLSLTDDGQDAVLFERWQRAGVGRNYRVWHASGGITGGWGQPLGAMQAWLAQQSLLYQMVRVSLRAEQPSHHLVWLLGGAYVQVHPARLKAVSAMAQPGQPAFSLVLEALAYMQVMAQAHGTQMVVVYLPSKEEIYPGVSPGDHGRALQEALAQRGITTLDLVPPFRQWRVKGEPLFLPVSAYLNAQGHALVAHQVLQYLATMAQPPLVQPSSPVPSGEPRTSLHTP